MIPERMLELAIFMNLENLCKISSIVRTYIEDRYDIEKIDNRYLILMKEFLIPYAKLNAEKSD